MEQLRKLDVIDELGILDNSIEQGIESEEFLFNLNEERAEEEKLALEEAERATGVFI